MKYNSDNWRDDADKNKEKFFIELEELWGLEDKLFQYWLAARGWKFDGGTEEFELAWMTRAIVETVNRLGKEKELKQVNCFLNNPNNITVQKLSYMLGFQQQKLMADKKATMQDVIFINKAAKNQVSPPKDHGPS